MTKRSVTVRMNAGQNDVVIYARDGDQQFSRADLTATQRGAINEMVVDYWCRVNGWRPLYGYDE